MNYKGSFVVTYARKYRRNHCAISNDSNRIITVTFFVVHDPLRNGEKTTKPSVSDRDQVRPFYVRTTSKRVCVCAHATDFIGFRREIMTIPRDQILIEHAVALYIENVL